MSRDIDWVIAIGTCDLPARRIDCGIDHGFTVSADADDKGFLLRGGCRLGDNQRLVTLAAFDAFADVGVCRLKNRFTIGAFKTEHV